MIICYWCDGSGEGLYDGSRCTKCKGSGVESDNDNNENDEEE